ncbi:MAG: signal recognition particle subunit SRP19/SEC65 family protein [Candidatus Kariarchaeaceae archaeon]
MYPEYFDANLSRSEGRRVSLELADPSPHLIKLSKACEKLNIECQIEKDKAYPSSWWKQSGRILIPIDKQNKVPKQILLKEIAEVSRKFVHKKKKMVTKKVSKKRKLPSSVDLSKPKRTASARRKRRT